MKNVVIIGGGLSGHLLLINLLRFYRHGPLKIVMLEKEVMDRLGVPYATQDEDHLLNVPAGNMSALADKKEHFASWLYSRSLPYTATSFVPRKIYRQYILDVFNRLMADKPASLQVVRLQAEATDVDMDKRAVLLKDGRAVPFDRLVLATGTFAADHLPLQDKTYLQVPGYFHSAWDASLPRCLNGAESIFIIGTGLTMTDTLISLHKAGHHGAITALSKHGLMPSVHRPCGPYPDFREEMRTQHTALGMLRMVRKHLRHAAHTGADWRSVIDALRPHTPGLWKQLPVTEKRAFMEHLRHYWEVSRHRMPESCAGIVSGSLSEGKVKIMAGRISNIFVTEQQRFDITIRERGSKKLEVQTADVIINCMGPATNYNRITQVLVSNLLQRGLICTDPLCLGVLCNDDGALVQKDGLISGCFYTLGAPAKGMFWETTAVPEIRVQAYQLAHKMLSTERPVVGPHVI